LGGYTLSEKYGTKLPLNQFLEYIQIILDFSCQFKMESSDLINFMTMAKLESKRLEKEKRDKILPTKRKVFW
jgi:hypothetical protein